MQVARKVLYVSVALAVTAGLVAVGARVTAPKSVEVSLAAVAGTQTAVPVNLDVLTEALNSVAFPPGTVSEDFPVTPGSAPTLLTPPSDVAVTPPACAELLSAGVGGLGKLSGLLQRGITPENTRIDKLAATASSGVNLNALRARAQSCSGASVTVRSLGLTGVLTFTEHEAPAIVGADSISIEQTVTFPGDDSELARTVAAAGSSLQTYISSGNTVVATCGSIWNLIDAIAEAIWDWLT